MSSPNAIDGRRLNNWAVRAVGVLSERRAEINRLNVFPVPDADTGSNMTHTMEAAVAEAAELGESELDDVVAVAQALATGSVRGARGNSGVVLSQVLRGIAQSVDEGPIDGQTFADALAIAVRLVDDAIADPVEGTVVTVLRAASTAATERVATDGSLADVATAATAAARTALAQTPSQLKALRDAGVVDAGGAGLLILLEAFLAEVEGTDFTPTPMNAPATHGVQGSLEVMFLFTADESAIAELEADLAPLGDSLLVARGDGEATFHIHTEAAGRVIERAYARGAVSDLRLEILPGGSWGDQASSRILLALTPPGPLAELYRSTGAVVVESSGPGDKGVVSEVLALIHRSGAREVVLLPNGLLDQRQLAAVDKSTRAFEQAITLLPTSRLVSGIAALAMHDDEQPLATATYVMSEAASAMRTAVLRRAEKAALTPGGPCARGDVLVEAHGGTVAVGESVADAVEQAARALLEAGGEQVTVISAEELDHDLLEARLGVDVMLFDGRGLERTGSIAEIGVE